MLVPDGLKSWDDHVPRVNVSGKGGGRVQGFLPLYPLGLVVNGEPVGKHVPNVRNRKGVGGSDFWNVIGNTEFCFELGGYFPLHELVEEPIEEGAKEPVADPSHRPDAGVEEYPLQHWFHLLLRLTLGPGVVEDLEMAVEDVKEAFDDVLVLSRHSPLRVEVEQLKNGRTEPGEQSLNHFPAYFWHYVLNLVCVNSYSYVSMTDNCIYIKKNKKIRKEQQKL